MHQVCEITIIIQDVWVLYCLPLFVILRRGSIEIGNKAEKYDELILSPGSGLSRPSGMTPAYEKPNGKQRNKKPGQKNGHEGVSRKTPEKIDHYKEHKLDHCPDCAGPLKDPIKSYTRYTEDIPPVEPEGYRTQSFWLLVRWV